MAKTSHTDDIWIEDERLSDLLRFLPYIRTTRRPDGRVHLNVTAPHCDAAEVHRQLMFYDVAHDGDRYQGVEAERLGGGGACGCR